MATTHGYRIRPGHMSDLPAVNRLYHAAFEGDSLTDFLFPLRKQHPRDVESYLKRRYLSRYWDPQFRLTMMVNPADRPVGFTWWKLPRSQISFVRWWLSPYTWFGSLVRACVSVCDYLFPIPSLKSSPHSAFWRVMEKITPQVLNTPRRQHAWYLSTVAVDPAERGAGLGSLLLKDGLEKVDQQGAVAWLVSVTGVEKFYIPYGFVEVARANIDEMTGWDGGAVMVRE